MQRLVRRCGARARQLGYMEDTRTRAATLYDEAPLACTGAPLEALQVTSSAGALSAASNAFGVSVSAGGASAGVSANTDAKCEYERGSESKSECKC